MDKSVPGSFLNLPRICKRLKALTQITSIVCYSSSFSGYSGRISANVEGIYCYHTVFLEGSTDSLYEPVPEQQTNQESTSVGTGFVISPFGESGKAHDNFFMEVSDFENAQPERKSIRRAMSENEGFERKTVRDTIWQEPHKPENDSHIRKLCQLKDLNEDDFLLSNNMHTFQGKKPQGISCQGHIINMKFSYPGL
ncbi:putative uncharacterized protein ENSP00000383407 [Mustela erminea]|uniref:putative uncharacterized protein ENSP00000383407 n=1 Tax=Mustela erminea TaxID=36723 RepID=UPI0013875DC1|nr:putative uncharacterized protein ENSP00000383407 [Mustela erminea]